ncbi:hypothetical protein [Caballeronia sp. DA-9]|uniref:hypothetical protein n=1 Tax=Caballeronia sp. DA-9 TaxID=3436237 RepID=UPI003F66EDBE
MFEKVVLRRAENGSLVTVGQIAEALLYYQGVHLVLDPGTLVGLAHQIGLPRLKTLLDLPQVSAVFCDEILATVTNKVGVTEFYDFAAVTMSGHEKGKLATPYDRIALQLERKGFARKDARKFSLWFVDLVVARKLSGNHFVKGGIPEAARSDLGDDVYMQTAIRQAILHADDRYFDGDQSLSIELLRLPNGVCAFSDIDFGEINAHRNAKAPPQEAVTIANLLTTILEARADLAMASHYSGDFVTSEVASSLIRLRYVELLQSTKEHADSQQKFVDVILPDAPSLAECIDSGERSFDEFLQLLSSASRFKNWITSVNIDENLVSAYMKAILSEDQVQGIKGKTLRYALTTGAGFMNPVVGVLTSLADTFLIEKLLSGWRPNHFVAKKLDPFVRVY